MAYTIEGRKSGTVRFIPEETGNIQSENVNLNSRVTANPVENGSDINDHVINESGRFSVSGTIIGGYEPIATLKTMRKNKDILIYTGRNRIGNLIITSLTFDHAAKNRTGANLKAPFQEISITTSERVEVGEMPPMTVQDAGKASTPQASQTSNAGTQSPVTQSISGSAYAAYVDSYGGSGGGGPATRPTASYSGAA